MVLPVEGAVVILEAAVFAVIGGLVVVVAGLEASRDVEGAVAGLAVFKTAAPSAFTVVEGPDFGPGDTAGLLVVAAGLGLAALTVFVAAPFTVVDLVPFVAVVAAAEVVLADPTGFLLGTLVWFLAVEGTAAAVPTGLLGIAPDVEADAVFVVAVVFLTAAVFADALLADLMSFAVRCEAVAGREVDADAPSVLDAGCFVLGLTLGFAATGFPLTLATARGGASFVASSGCDGACSVMLAGEEDSATAAASVGSVVSMLTPSGFIPS